MYTVKGVRWVEFFLDTRGLPGALVTWSRLLEMRAGIDSGADRLTLHTILATTSAVVSALAKQARAGAAAMGWSCA